MKQLLLFAAAPLALALAQPASAEVYAAARIGMSDATVGGGFDLQNVVTYGGAIGVDFGRVRVEGGVERGAAELFPGFDASLTNVSATVLADFRGPFGITAFAGIGADYSMAAATGFGSANGDGEGWHYDLGGSVSLDDQWDIELRRRAYDGDVDLGGPDFGVEATTWTLGVRRAF